MEHCLINTVFIGGAPRSGTSLVQKILALHPDVFAGPEFDHLGSIVRLWEAMNRGLATGRQKAFFDHQQLEQSFRAFLEGTLYAQIVGGRFTHFSEKTPENVLVFNELAKLFPSAKFIFVVRDPRAVIFSFKNVEKRALEKGDNRKQHGLHGLVGNVERVKHAICAGDAFERQWPGRCHVVYYEDLVEAPRVAIQALCAFLMLPFREEMMRTERETMGSSIAAADGVWYTKEMYDRPITVNSAHLWKTGLSPDEAICVERAFAMADLSCLERYKLRRQCDLPRLQLLKAMLIHEGTSAVLRQCSRGMVRRIVNCWNRQY